MVRPLIEPFLPGINDTGIALFGAVLLFILPVDVRKGTFVLNWEWAVRLPWGVLILFGGD
jgi:solute carrier family 13 (sodium-dependent dicarboxylate transporter), member 2/3/5